MQRPVRAGYGGTYLKKTKFQAACFILFLLTPSSKTPAPPNANPLFVLCWVNEKLLQDDDSDIEVKVVRIVPPRPSGIVKLEPWDGKMPTRRPWVVFTESLADPKQRHPRDEELPGCQMPLRSETAVGSNCLILLGCVMFGFLLPCQFFPMYQIL